jgi:uncharacterized protein (TIGR02145 family)
MHYLISIIFLFSLSGVFAQSIENVDFRSEGKTIVVTNDFFHSKTDSAINVELVFKDPQGGVVTPKTIIGDRTITPIEVDIPAYDQKDSMGTIEGTKESFDDEENENFAPLEDNGPKVQDNPKEIIETFVDEDAEFPGGHPAILAWIQKNLVFPEKAIENNIQGKCFLRFVVSVDGSISSLTVTKGVPNCPECDKAAIMAIKSMPNWEAGKINGRSVPSYCSIPINFAIDDAEPADVLIRTQTWQAKNLNVSHFRNGDLIPEAKTAIKWRKAGKKKRPAWCYYDNDPANGEKYGKLYNWYAINDVRGLAPVDWHIPRDEEWTIFSVFLGGDHVAGKAMMSSTSWKKNVDSSNVSDFNALLGGYRQPNGKFYSDVYTEDRNVGNLFGAPTVGVGYWWSASTFNDSDAWCRTLYDSKSGLYRSNSCKSYGFSVRCVKD